MPPQLPEFHPRTAAEQAANALREALQVGHLPDPLPGEHVLAAHFGLSRPTVRRALSLLAQEGWLTLRKGSRTRLRQPHAPRPTGQRAVCALVAVPTHPHSENPVLAELRRALGPEVAWEVLSDARLASPRPQRRVAALVAARPGVCWVLAGSTPELQAWFARSGVPTLVLGSGTEPGVLPSVDLDYRAVGWHAAGQLLRAGCRRIILAQPPRLLPGDEATHAGLAAYLAHRGEPPPMVLRWPSATAGCATLDRALQSGGKPGFLSLRPLLTLTLLTHLLRRGIRLPQEAALISRDSEPFLQAALPSPARYESTPEARVRRAARILHALAAGTLRPPWPEVRLMPGFTPGQTL